MTIKPTIWDTLDLPIPSSENPTPEELEQVNAERKRLIQEAYMRYDMQLRDHLRYLEWKEKGLPVPEPTCVWCETSCHCFLTMTWLANYNELEAAIEKRPASYHGEYAYIGRPYPREWDKYLQRCWHCGCDIKRED